MKKSTKIIIAIATVLILIGGVIGYLVYRDLKQEKMLNSEIEKVMVVDLTKDEVDMTIKTSGDYAKVEKTIKTYLNDYGKKSREILKKVDEKSFSEVLSANNLKTDAPEFVNSQKTITTINEVITEIEKLSAMTDKNYIMEQIEKQNLDKYYNDLYEKIMFDEKTSEELSNIKNELVAANKKLEKLSSVYKEAINLLKENKGKWEISNNQLYFYNQDLANKYNKIIANL